MPDSEKVAKLEKRIQELENENKTLRRKIFDEFLLDSRYLIEVDQALYDYKKQVADDNYLTSAVRDFMNAFTSFFEIERILDFGNEVIYDPEKHRCQPNTHIKPNAKAIVILPGWRQKNTNKQVLPLVKPVDHT